MNGGTRHPRSVSSSKRHRKAGPPVLVVCGRGFAATAVLELLPLLTQAGFEPRVAFTDEALAWVPAEPVRQLSGASFFLEGSAGGPPPPNWAKRSDPFVATFALGLPRLAFTHFVAGNLWDWLPIPLRGRTGPVFLWAAEDELDGLEIPDRTRQGFLELRVLPMFPGQIRAAVERGFAEFIAGWQRRGHLGTKTFSLQRAVPAGMEALSEAPPAWHLDLFRRLLLFGLKEVDPGHLSGADLVIDTYEGPFSRDALPGTMNWVPTDRKPVRIQFLHQLIPAEVLEWLLEQGVNLVIRQQNGDLLWKDGHTTRLIPNLSERPALSRLADHLADLLSASGS